MNRLLFVLAYAFVALFFSGLPLADVPTLAPLFAWMQPAPGGGFSGWTAARMLGPLILILFAFNRGQRLKRSWLFLLPFLAALLVFSPLAAESVCAAWPSTLKGVCAPFAEGPGPLWLTLWAPLGLHGLCLLLGAKSAKAKK